MPDTSEPQATLLDAVRVAARGGDLESRLRQLASHVRRLTGASFSVLYLFDADSRLIVPFGSDGLPEEAARRGQLAVDQTDDPVARAVRERRAQFASRGAGAVAPATTGEVAAFGAVPLLAEDISGNPEVQGVLAVGLGALPPDTAALEEQLWALADLAAIAVRHSRLEQALLERADWIERVAQSDPLTGLANRRTFERMLELELARAVRAETPVSVILFGVDGFAEMEQRAGGEVTDNALRAVASALADSVRLLDTVARLARDEFGCVAPGAAGGTVAARVRENVSRIPAGAAPPVTVSAGVARVPDDGATVEELVRAASEALEEARREGPGRIAVRGEGIRL